jgi:Protein of unknown function (DUF2281)
MNAKQKIIEEIENAPEEIVCEVLDFLLFLKAKEDLEDAQAALKEAREVGTISLGELKKELGL